MESDAYGIICPYNMQCRCQVADCESCGWNPEIREKRLEKVAEENRLIFAKDARRAILLADPTLTYIIDNLRSVDAVTVRRCKDCVQWKKAKADKDGHLICPLTGMKIMAHDYCSKGGRG